MGTSDDGPELRIVVCSPCFLLLVLEHAVSCPSAVIFQSSGLRGSSHRFESKAEVWGLRVSAAWSSEFRV